MNASMSELVETGALITSEAPTLMHFVVSEYCDDKVMHKIGIVDDTLRIALMFSIIGSVGPESSTHMMIISKPSKISASSLCATLIVHPSDSISLSEA